MLQNIVQISATTTIALSTNVTEYGGFSQAVRAILPIRKVLLEIIKTVCMIGSNNRCPFGNKIDSCSFLADIHENNSIALSLVVNQNITSRTKHLMCQVPFLLILCKWYKEQHQLCQSGHQRKESWLSYQRFELAYFEYCYFLNQGWWEVSNNRWE